MIIYCQSICWNGSDTAYAYAYDDNGNITSSTKGTTSVTYQYNGANELIRESDGMQKVNELKQAEKISKRKGQDDDSVVIY